VVAALSKKLVVLLDEYATKFSNH